jgi:hypothetical protein
MKKGKFLTVLGLKSDLSVVQLVASHYIDCATRAQHISSTVGKTTGTMLISICFISIKINIPSVDILHCNLRDRYMKTRDNTHCTEWQ